MKALKILILIVVLALSFLGCKHADNTEPVAAVAGKVIKVVDGDTLHICNSKGTYKIRLSGIDAPETGQAYGKRAKEHLAQIVAGKQVIAIVDSKDRYGRYVAKVNCQSQDVCAEMLRAGYAWHYKRYDGNKYYAELQTEARKAKRGLWKDGKPVPPWDYRKMKREKSSEKT